VIARSARHRPAPTGSAGNTTIRHGALATATRTSSHADPVTGSNCQTSRAVRGNGLPQVTPLCDRAAVDVWSHDGKLYEVASGYSVADDAWHYELTGLTGIPGTGPYLAVAIPDATPDDGPFTPHAAEHALIAVADGVTPWPILRRLLDLVIASGDLPDALPVAPSDGEELLSHNLWSSDDQQFEVNSFHYAERDAWCYELCPVRPGTAANDYIEIQVPDAHPASGPFTPVSADRVTLTGHGQCDIPWPIFRRFLAAIHAAGDIVIDQTGQG